MPRSAHLPRRHPDSRLGSPPRGRLAVESLQLLLEVPNLHVPSFPPRGHEAGVLLRRADAVDPAVVRDGEELQHRLSRLDLLRFVLVLAFAAVLVAVVAVACPRLNTSQLSEADELDAVVAWLCRLSASDQIQRVRERISPVAKLVSQDVEAAEADERPRLSSGLFALVAIVSKSSLGDDAPEARPLEGERMQSVVRRRIELKFFVIVQWVDSWAPHLRSRPRYQELLRSSPLIPVAPRNISSIIRNIGSFCSHGLFVHQYVKDSSIIWHACKRAGQEASEMQTQCATENECYLSRASINVHGAFVCAVRLFIVLCLFSGGGNLLLLCSLCVIGKAAAQQRKLGATNASRYCGSRLLASLAFFFFGSRPIFKSLHDANGVGYGASSLFRDDMFLFLRAVVVLLSASLPAGPPPHAGRSGGGWRGAHHRPSRTRLGRVGGPLTLTSGAAITTVVCSALEGTAG